MRQKSNAILNSIIHCHNLIGFMRAFEYIITATGATPLRILCALLTSVRTTDDATFAALGIPGIVPRTWSDASPKRRA